MSTAPAIRAAAVRDTLAYLDRVEENGQARVLAKVPESSRAIILETARSSSGSRLSMIGTRSTR